MFPVVDGGWTDWADTGGACTATCGGGTKPQSRTCTYPAPENGGADCAGDASQDVACNTNACPGGSFSSSVFKELFIFYAEYTVNIGGCLFTAPSYNMDWDEVAAYCGTEGHAPVIKTSTMWTAYTDHLNSIGKYRVVHFHLALFRDIIFVFNFVSWLNK